MYSIISGRVPLRVVFVRDDGKVPCAVLACPRLAGQCNPGKLAGVDLLMLSWFAKSMGLW